MNSDKSICNEELELGTQNYGLTDYSDMVDLDSFLKNMNEDDLYNSMLYNKSDSTLESVLPPLHNEPFASDITLSPPTNTVLPTFALPVTIKTEPQVTIAKAPFVFSPVVDTNAKSNSKTSAKKPRVTKEKVDTVVVAAAPVAPVKEDDKYQRRLQANKKSAQASRERKKALKAELEVKLESLTKENAVLRDRIIQMDTENKVLKNEYVELQNLISNSKIMSNSLASTPLPIQIDSTEPVKPNQAAAALYLMIVLHSFGNMFGGKTPFALPGSFPTAPTPLSVN